MKERWVVDGHSAQRQYVIKWKGHALKKDEWSRADHNDEHDLAAQPDIKRRWRAKTPREEVPWELNKAKRRSTAQDRERLQHERDRALQKKKW